MNKKQVELELIGGEITYLRPVTKVSWRQRVEDIFTAFVILGGTIAFAVFLYAVFN